MRVYIDIGKDEEKILKKRAESNFFSLKEQIEDIIRRSCISAKKKSPGNQPKIDDKLVEIFSKDTRGKKTKKKKKKKKKKTIKTKAKAKPKEIPKAKAKVKKEKGEKIERKINLYFNVLNKFLF